MKGTTKSKSRSLVHEAPVSQKVHSNPPHLAKSNEDVCARSGDGSLKRKRTRSTKIKENFIHTDFEVSSALGKTKAKVKKKSVTWNEVLDVKSIEGRADASTPHPRIEKKPQVNGSLASTGNILSLLCQTDTTVHKKPPVQKTLTRAEKKKAGRALRKAQSKAVKALKKEAETSKLKTIRTISDLNIKNRKLKEKLPEMEPKIERKRPRPDEETSSLPPRTKKRFNSPKLVLLNHANSASLLVEDEDRSPLTLSDIQHFLIYTLHLHNSTGNLPTWVSLKNPRKVTKVICLVVNGVSLSDYTSHENELPTLKSFESQVDVLTPCSYGGDFVSEFFNVPLTSTQRMKLIKKHGSIKEAVIAGEANMIIKRVCPTGAFRTTRDASYTPKTKKVKTNGNSDPAKNGDVFPRTELLLKTWDLLKERVPVPFATGYLAQRYRGFVPSKDCYDEVTDSSPIWAIDCEMCQTKVGSELTRISIINESFEVVYESLVKPYNPIVNYLTQYSGITPKDLQNEWTRLEDVQEEVRFLLPPDVILTGHSIGNDLLAMKMFHPYIIDTSVCFNLSGVRGHKAKLKTLMAELLSERIQDGGSKGHDSVEDAASCLKLLKAKLARSFEWGDAVLSGKMSEQESLIAQQLLLRRDMENKEKPVYPVAKNAIIRCGPRLHQGVIDKNPDSQKGPNNAKNVGFPSVTPLERSLKRLAEAYDDEVPTKCLFTHLLARDDKHVLVVGDKEFVSRGEEVIKSKFHYGLPGSKVNLSKQKRKNVVSYGCENAPSSGLSIIQLRSRNCSAEDALQEVDRLVREAVEKLTDEHTLFSVFFAGKDSGEAEIADDNHGLFLMKLLTPSRALQTEEEVVINP